MIVKTEVGQVLLPDRLKSANYQLKAHCDSQGASVTSFKETVITCSPQGRP